MLRLSEQAPRRVAPPNTLPVADVKTAAKGDLTVWAAARGEGNTAELTAPGWKERWQVTGAEGASCQAPRHRTAEDHGPAPAWRDGLRSRWVRGCSRAPAHDSTVLRRANIGRW